MEAVVRANAQPPLRRQRSDAGQVPVELRGEEARPAHLAVADDVDPGPLLVADREIHTILEQLGEVGRPVLASLCGRDRRCEPSGVCVRPDDTRQQWLVTHRLTSENANARRGLSTKSRWRTPSGSWGSISGGKASNNQASPGEPPKTR